MTTAAPSVRAQPERVAQAGYPADDLRFDWRFVFLASLFVGGLMVDGWAHFHGQVDDSFFTPWHFLFYSAFGMVALFLGYHQYRNVSKGHTWRQALPRGYWLSLVGAAIFAVGGVGDLIWHTLFGIEGGTEALLSPSHITLAIGIALVVTGPLRAAWQRSANGWKALFPAIMGAALVLLLLAFFATYAHPFIFPVAADFGSESAEEVLPTNELYVMNADGTHQTRLTVNPEVSSAMGRYSPDGSQIVYAQGDLQSETGESAIFVMDADGSSPVQLTEMAGREFQPIWSPDGSQIAFLHTVDERADLYVMDADGGNLRQVTNTREDNEGMPAWSPDGSQFAITVFEDNVFTLFLVDAESGERTLFSEDAASAAWSPDGGKIAYGKATDGDYDLYMANADGSEATRLTDAAGFDAFPAWSPDGSEILFISIREGTPQLYKMPATGETGAEPAVNLIQNLSQIVFNPMYSPDGSQILYNARAEAQDVGGGDTSTQDAGVTAILVQSALMAGVVILMARRWSLPFGAFTLILTVSTLFITVMSDLYVLVPGAIIAGLVADVLARWLKPSGDDRNGLFLFAFLVPTIYYGLYMLSVQLVFGMGWSIHVWTGAIFLAGMVGLLLSFLTLSTNRAPSQQAA